jgi:Ca2+-binding EF-hand superfamily protein
VASSRQAEEGLREDLVRAAAMQMFRRADTDGSGSLSQAEFEAALSFKALNRNMDGVIDQAEFLQA